MNKWALVLSGSSLDLEECIQLEKSDFKLCAVNCAWSVFSFHRVDIIYGMDLAFWQAYVSQIESAAECWTSNATAAQRFGLNLDQRSYHPFEVNSGLRACMFLLKRFNPDCLYLFGLGGEGHFHADHDSHQHKSLTNPGLTKVHQWATRWSELHRMIKRHYPNTQVWNGSAASESTFFPYRELFLW
ncbi:hypothetical protein COMNV_00450 [Commensalibacter sp. Nvir]|uniref:hypothetical protein n=1 Tax=Commensalibacter sp. Nvir TaxID=3069817 RepID=UPI002D67997D|nr:hypothetical protein COMNV_00450 [Commensalibacter sp. Nvir]